MADTDFRRCENCEECKGWGTAQSSGLPWSREPGEQLRLWAAVALVLTFALPLAVFISTATVPERERAHVEKIPPQLAKLIDKPTLSEPDTQLVKPAEPEIETVEVKEPELVREPTLELKPEPEPEPEPKSEQQAKAPETDVVEQEPADTTVQTVGQARAVAARSGLLAMQDQLAAMREPEVSVIASVANVTGNGAGVGDAPNPEDVLAGSGGVDDTAGPVGAVALAEHKVQRVSAPIDTPVTPSVPVKAAAASSERAMSNIRQVFDSQKTTLFAIYNRELRQDPTLEGKVLLELVIEPDGRVSDCKVVSSELSHPALETRLANRVRLFNFGEADVNTRTVRFPIDFLPS